MKPTTPLSSTSNDGTGPGAHIKTVDMPRHKFGTGGVIVVVDGTCCRPTYPDTYYGIRLGDAPPNGLGVDGAGVQVGHRGRARRRRRRVVQVLSMSWELELLNPSTGLVLVSVQSPIDHIDRYSGGQEKKKIATNMVNERQQTSATPGTGYTHSRTVQTGEGTKKKQGGGSEGPFFFLSTNQSLEQSSSCGAADFRHSQQP